jgi:hypothetical protein
MPAILQHGVKPLLRRAVLALALGLTACAGGPPPTTAMLTYLSNPEGATLYEGGQAIGTAPVTRTYQSDGKSDNIRTPDVTAVWPSGAKEVWYTYLKVGTDRNATIERPKAAPGLEADLENGRKFAAAREQDAKRMKEQLLREQARASDRCKAQISGASKAVVDDC